MAEDFFVYMLASDRHGTLYVGVTSNLLQRTSQHREGLVEGFTREHGVKQLAWFEQHADAISAITREKQLKKWRRAWKIKLVQKENPQWRDLFDELAG